MRNSKKGFTIVELVIVIAVIAILAAVLIPTFSGIIDNANKSAAEQEARNAYTNYLSDAVANGDTIIDNVCVFVKGYYVFLNNGSVDTSKTVEAAKDTADAKFTGWVKAFTKEAEIAAGTAKVDYRAFKAEGTSLTAVGSGS